MRKTRLLHIAIICTAIAMLISPIVYYVMPFSPVGQTLVVAELTLPDGRDLFILQRFTGTLEPYEVRFVTRRPDGHADEYYLDHESIYWRGALILDTDREEVRITFYGESAARYDYVNDAFFINGSGGFGQREPLGDSRRLSDQL
jgi:hypothetical protein